MRLLKGKKSQERARDDSVPKAELDAVKSNLQGKITELQKSWRTLDAANKVLEKKLATSNSEIDSLRADIAQLQNTLAESIRKAESEAKVNQLETKLSDARRELEVAKTKIDELQAKLSNSVPRTEMDSARAEAESRIQELQEKLSDSKSNADALQEKVAALEPKVAEAERKLDAARSRIKELEAAAPKPPTEEKLSEPTA